MLSSPDAHPRRHGPQLVTVMDNVIPLPRRSRFIRECQMVDSALKTVTMLRNRHEAEGAARNLRALIEEARQAGVRVGAIATRAWGGRGRSDPAKRLYKNTLPRTAGLTAEDESARARRRKYLQLHTKNYVDLAEALAAEMAGRPGWGRQEVLVRLFRNTKVNDMLDELVESRAAASMDPDSCWQALASQMEQAAAWVARESGLHAHLARMASTRGSYDLADDVIRPNTGLLLPHGPLDGNYEVSEEFPPIPSVPLVDELIADVPAAILTLEAVAGGQPTTLSVRGRVWRELRLAVGPADVPEQPAALFEVRTRVEIAIEGRPTVVRRPWIYLPEWDVEVELDGQVRRGVLALGDTPPGGGDWRDLLAWPNFDGSGRPLQPEHCYAVWRLVTASACEELLAHRLAQTDRLFRLPFEPMDAPTLAPIGSLGAAVELALVTEDGPRLDLALLREARRLVSIVESHVAERRRQALDMHDRAAVRWATPGDSSEPDRMRSPSGEPGS